MRYELNGIRGYKVCPKCSAEVNERFQFCGRCGARLPDVEDENFMALDSSDLNLDNSNISGCYIQELLIALSGNSTSQAVPTYGIACFF